MKYLLTIPAAVTLLALATFAQDNASAETGCTSRMVTSISSRGIKIGAAMDDVLNLFASNDVERQKIRHNFSGPDNSSIGYEFFSVGTSTGSGKGSDRFEGVSGYIFEFLDRKLAGFSVNYTKPNWENAEQLADKMAQFFGLPRGEAWSGSNEVKQLRCEDYKLSAQVNQSGGVFAIYDLRLGKFLKERRDAAEQAQRESDLKVFKP